MKCEEVQELVTEYIDKQLPEMTRRRVDHHLSKCECCRSEYSIWSGSNDWLKSEKEQYAALTPQRSIVDVVMARILSEEKWAIPIGKKVFTLTARMRRIGVSAAAILLMLCSFTLFTNSDDQGSAGNLFIPKGETLTALSSQKTQVVSASIRDDDGVYVVDSRNVTSDQEPMDEISPTPRANEVASAAPQLMSLNGDSDSGKPNYKLILSFFGILIAVLSMSWVTRA